MPRLEKFSEKSLWAFSTRNLTWNGVKLEEDDSLEQGGFRDGVDLHLGAMRKLFERERNRERERDKLKSTNQQIYQKEKRIVRMHEKCMIM